MREMDVPIASIFGSLAVALWLFVLTLAGTGAACGYLCYRKGRCRSLAVVCIICAAALGSQAHEAAKSFGSANAFVRTCVISTLGAAVAAWVCYSRKVR